MANRFASWTSIDQEIGYFKNLTRSDPEKARHVFATGEQLITLARNGSLSKLKRFIDETERSDMLIYFVSKALHESLEANHLMVAAYIIDSGYPLNFHSIPSALIHCVERLDDQICESTARFLVQKGVDVNKAVRCPVLNKNMHGILLVKSPTFLFSIF
jgi:hypothetical protein